jgi:hypothetical protein
MILESLLFADDQLLIAKSEDELQWAIYNLQKTVLDFNMSISTDKTKLWHFQAKTLLGAKAV